MTPASGKPPASDLATGRDQVRLDPAVLDGEHPPCAAEAALDLIDNQQDAVLITQRPQQPEHLRAHRVEATLALHRLNDDRRHAAGLDIREEELIHRMLQILHRHPGVRRRER